MCSDVTFSSRCQPTFSTKRTLGVDDVICKEKHCSIVVEKCPTRCKITNLGRHLLIFDYKKWIIYDICKVFQPFLLQLCTKRYVL